MPYTTSGIQINSRFVQNAAIPLDNRYTCANAAQRATIPAGVLYNGLQVWLEDVKQLTVWDGSSWIVLSGGGGITSLNGLTAATQTFATGTSGTNFNISSSGTVHTFNIPDASASARGLVNTTTQAFSGSKSFNNNFYISSSTTPVSGPGTRFMWIPSKAALRAGYVDGNQWNHFYIGQYSIGLGYNALASKLNSVAVGEASTASGISSVAFAGGTASGNNSLAFGYSIASGNGSLAFGDSCVASQISSVAFASSTSSGYSSVAFVGSTASGNSSLAFIGSTASDNFSVAFVNSTALNASAVAFVNSNATGDSSIAFVNSTASGSLSIAFANATASNYKAAAFTGSTASGNSSVAFGSSTASGNYGFAAGLSTASGDYGVSFSQGQATAVQSFAFGYNCISSGIGAFSFGHAALASGVHSFARGFGVVSRDRASTSIGQYNEDVTVDYNFYNTNNVALGIGNGIDQFDRRNVFKMTFGGQTYINNTGVAITQTASSILDLRSTTLGFLAPRMTSAQRNVISTPATGLQIYNTTNNQYESYNGVRWANIGAHITNDNILQEVFRLESIETNDNPYVSYVQGKVTTTDATVTTLKTFPTVLDTTYSIKVRVLARRTGGTAGTNGDSALYEKVACFRNILGTVTQLGTTTDLVTIESVPAYDVTFDILATDIRLRVTGVANTNITWHLVKAEVSSLSL